MSTSVEEHLIRALIFFDSVVAQRGWGDAEALEQAYRNVNWGLAAMRTERDGLDSGPPKAETMAESLEKWKEYAQLHQGEYRIPGPRVQNFRCEDGDCVVPCGKC